MHACRNTDEGELKKKTETDREGDREKKSCADCGKRNPNKPYPSIFPKTMRNAGFFRMRECRK